MTPLEDPTYVPEHPLLPGGRIPVDAIEKWGAASQCRWFLRYNGQIAPHPPGVWNRLHCESDKHLGQCCDSCLEDMAGGYMDYDEDWCCCRATRDKG